MHQPDALGAADALTELQGLMVSVALGLTPDRAAATRYVQCRDRLLAGPAARLLPGFLGQCVSIASFRTFIGLYHRDRRVRQHFIEQSLAPAAEAIGGAETRTSAFGFDFDGF